MAADLWINNQWVEGEGAPFSSTEPGTDALVWQGSAATATQVDEAMQAAHAALPGWRSRPLEERYAYLKAYQEALQKDAEGLAELLARETGKPLWEAKTEVSAMAGKIDITWEAYQERCAERIFDAPGGASQVRFMPIGVMGVLGPFNLPGHLPNGHLVPALLAGNTCILKPSELTPAVGERMAGYFAEAAFPPGVVNVVQGAVETGQALSEHAALDGLLFTGSYATGRALHASFAGQPQKMLALEMGGNNPLVVHSVENLEAAVYYALLSAFITTGQRCVCARRLIVTQDANPPALLDRLCEAASQLRFGHWRQDPEPFMGPLISTRQAQRVKHGYERLRQQAQDEPLPLLAEDEESGLLSPAVLLMKPDAPAPDEELFGPVLQVQVVDSLDDAIEAANATAYGLSASLLSDERADFERFCQGVHAGVINWNQQTTGASSRMPFGGVGQSGNYRPSGYYAVDYCAYPIASMQKSRLALPEKRLPGMPSE
mgnify:CR=1 FL=1